MPEVPVRRITLTDVSAPTWERADSSRHGRLRTASGSQAPPGTARPGDTFVNGFSVDGLLTRQIVRHVGIKAGVTFDFNFETTNFQPVVLGVIQF